MVICPNCGSTYEDGAKFCSTCGSKLPDASAAPEIFVNGPAAPAEPAPQPEPAPQQPVYQADPGFTQQPYQQPAPAYQQPNYQQPVYQQPPYQQPNYQQPPYQQPPYQQPVNPQPPYQDPNAPKEKAPKKGGIGKLIGIIAGAAALVALVVFVILPLFSGGGSGLRKDYLQAGSPEDEWLGFGKSGKVVKLNNDNAMDDGTTSADGSKIIIVDTEKDMYLFDGTKFTKLASEVENFLLSFDGNTVAYMDEDDALYLISGTGKPKKIAEDVSDLRTISPDGKAVGYTRQDDDNTRGYYYDGKEHEIGKNMTPYALSAGSKYVYYRNKDGVLYVQKGENSDDRQKIVDTVSSATFNKNGTQIIATTRTDDGYKTYFVENGGERKEVSKTQLRILTPTRIMSSNRFVGVDSLKNQLYYTYDSDDGYAIYRVNSKLETKSCVKNAFRVVLQEDFKTITYLKNDKLYIMDTSKSDPEGKALASDVDSYLSSVNGKVFLYENKDKETYTVTTSGKPQKVVGEEVDEWAAVGDGFLYILEEELYFTTGGKGSKVSAYKDTAVDLEGFRDYVLILGEDDTTYLTNDGKKIVKIYEAE